MTTKATTLNDLLAEVSAGMARIEKKGKAPAGMGGFAFVQESDVIERLKPLLDERGIRLIPDIEDTQLHFYDRQGKDGPGVLATVKLAMYAIKGEEQALLFRSIGQGADTQDKAPAKAVTAAKKQGFLNAFAIPTGDDPEATLLEANDDRTPVVPSRGGGSSGGAASGTRGGSEKPADTSVQGDPDNKQSEAASDRPITEPQKRLIRAKAREAGVSDDQLATLRLQVTGKHSSAQMTNGDVQSLIETLADTALIAAALTGGTVE